MEMAWKTASSLLMLCLCCWVTVGEAGNSSSFIGCFNDTIPRTLPFHQLESDQMTQEPCFEHCLSKGYEIAGVQANRHCFCGKDFPEIQKPASDCKRTCTGNASQICGGTWRNSVYRLRGWFYAGCFNDSKTRTLPFGQLLENQMTQELCFEHCLFKGYEIAGLEYADECYCGENLPDQLEPDSKCNMACGGNPSQICGGFWHSSVYRLAASVPESKTFDLDCHKTADGLRCFKVLTALNGTLPTVDRCWADCASQNMQLARVDSLSLYSALKAAWEANAIEPACTSQCGIPCSYWVAGKRDASVPRFVWEEYEGQPVSEAPGLEVLWPNFKDYWTLDTSQNAVVLTDLFDFGPSGSCSFCKRCACLCESYGNRTSTKSHFKISYGVQPQSSKMSQLIQHLVLDSEMACARECHKDQNCFSIAMTTVAPGQINCSFYSAIDLIPVVQEGVNYAVITDWD